MQQLLQQRGFTLPKLMLAAIILAYSILNSFGNVGNAISNGQDS